MCNERNSEGLRSAAWAPGWECPLQRSFERARCITPNKPTTSPVITLMDKCFGQVARALRDGASVPQGFILLLRLLAATLTALTGAGYNKLKTFGVPNGAPFCDFSREVRVVVSTATGTERVQAPGAESFLEVVRMAVNEQYPSLMPTLYSGVMATEARHFGALDAMRLAFQALANTKASAINGEKQIPSLLLRRACGHPPRRDDHGPPVMGAARAGRLPSRLDGRRDRAIILMS